MRIRRVLALGATAAIMLAACSSGATPSPSAQPSAAASPSVAASPSPEASASPAASPSVAACAPTGAGAGAAMPTVRIGSDNFYESKVMAEMYAQVLEKAGYTVDRKFGLGSRQDRAPAFEQGQVDLVPEYVGSGLGYYDKTQVTGDGEANRTALQAVFDSKDCLATVFAISPGQDNNAAVVRKDTADSLHLVNMSDLAAVQDQLKWGLPPDCDANPLCKGALETYGITYPPTQRQALAACDAPIAQALQAKAIDFAWLCSTQPAILQFGFVQLVDDKKTQPAENIAPLARNDFLAKVPDPAAFQAILDAVSAKVTTDVLLDLGVKVGVDQEDISKAAKDFLTSQGLL